MMHGLIIEKNMKENYDIPTKVVINKNHLKLD